MKTKQENKAVPWILNNTKRQWLPLGILVAGNALLASSSVAFALLCKEILDSVSGPHKDLTRLAAFAGFLLGLIALQLILRVAMRSLLERITAKLEITLKSGLFSQILHKDYSEVTSFHSGELLNLLVSDVAVVSEGVTAVVSGLVTMVAKLGSAFAALVVLDKTFALIFLVGGLALFFFTRLFRKLLKQLHKRVQEADGRLRSFLQEALESLLMIKAFSVQDKTERNAGDLQQTHYKAKMKRRTASILANAGVGFVFQLGYLFSLVFCAYRLFTGDMSFGTLTAVLQLVNQVQSPFVSLSGLLPKYYAVLASAERIMEIEALPDEDSGCEPQALPPVSQPVDVPTLYGKLDQIVFSRVTFAYHDRLTVLRDATFSLRKGEFVAVTGLSGIGKSTVLKLMLGVYPGYQGEIFLQTRDDRIPISGRTRGLFAYVPQGNFIMSGTIRENLTFVKEDATEQELHRALAASCADQFLSDLPKGLDTVISEKGHGLSEGQVQRLAIARAILSGAPVLLLDEVTSALDEATEARLLANLRRLHGITCLIISHKKAAIELCDSVLHFDGQRIIKSYTSAEKE